MLRAGSLYRITLNADLVTLSACETALGKITKGDDVSKRFQILVAPDARDRLRRISPSSGAQVSFRNGSRPVRRLPGKTGMGLRGARDRRLRIFSDRNVDKGEKRRFRHLNQKMPLSAGPGDIQTAATLSRPRSAEAQ
ncbi:MAG: CHAT domain-containing protein [Pseudomonadota bacterium]